MSNKNEEVLFRKEIKYPAAIGDWTQYQPSRPPFKRPSYIPYKISKIPHKELAKILDMHSQFTFLFLASLQNSLKLSTELFTSSVEQLLYEDFVKRMDFPLLYVKLAIPERGEILLCLDFSLINSIINFSLGCPNKVISPRNLTEVEESIVTSIIEKNLSNLTSCWHDALEKPEFRIISCPAMLREPSINPNEVITQFTSITALGGAPPARLIFAYQSGLLRSLIETLHKKEKEKTADLEKIPSAILESVSIPITAELGGTTITANELVGIEEDDIIQLDTKLSDTLKVDIGEKINASGQPGLKDNRYAVRLGLQKASSLEKPFTIEEPSEELLPEEDSSEKTGSLREEAVSEEELPVEEEEKGEYNTSKEEDLFGEEDAL